ncbi:MAG: hypothetical protein M1339_05990, partial [Bacteroidetes bacterium]|nr:hypothetical protein [Bacteroidota bacterium]
MNSYCQAKRPFSDGVTHVNDLRKLKRVGVFVKKNLSRGEKNKKVLEHHILCCFKTWTGIVLRQHLP